MNWNTRPHVAVARILKVLTCIKNSDGITKME